MLEQIQKENELQEKYNSEIKQKQEFEKTKCTQLYRTTKSPELQTFSTIQDKRSTDAKQALRTPYLSTH